MLQFFRVILKTELRIGVWGIAAMLILDIIKLKEMVLGCKGGHYGTEY